MHYQVDIAIIGAGTAGLSAYKESSKHTNNILLLDGGKLGTTCARVGCMPSKVLIECANSFYNSEHHLPQLGIVGSENLSIDIPAVLRHVQEMRDSFTKGVIEFTKNLDKNFIAENAKFIKPNVLQAGKHTIFAEKIIIATGSRNFVPSHWQSFEKKLLSSDNIFEQQNLPEMISVIGGGVIGLELGQALARLGIKVCLYHSGTNIGGISDPSVNQKALDIFSNELQLLTNYRADITYNNATFKITTKGNKLSQKTPAVLATLGRRPNLESLDLIKANILLNEKGLPNINPKTLQIDNHPVFIAGDVNASHPILHEAADDGRIAGFNACQSKVECFQRRVPLSIIFTQPNIIQVGCPYKNLPEDVIIGEVHFEDQGRSKILQQNAGILRVYAKQSSGEILGAEGILPAGEHIAHWLALAIQQKLSVHHLLQAPFYHPTIEEGLRTALRNLQDKTIEKPERLELPICRSHAAPSLD